MPRDSFLLRLDPKVLAAVKQWAEDELRSTNGHIEYLLRAALRDAGRLPTTGKTPKKSRPPGKETHQDEDNRSDR